jgi:soluble lytic murein transglycosylase
MSAAEAWFVPDEETMAAVRRTPAAARFRDGVDLYQRGEFDRALATWAEVDLSDTPLGPYVEYYRARAELARARWSEARRRFASLGERRPLGYLTEAAVVGEAQAAEGEGDYASAVRLYDQVAPRATKQPEEIWRRLGQAALAAGDRRRAAQAFARVRSDYPLSPAAVEAGRLLDALGDSFVTADVRRALEWQRAERLFAARRYEEARAAWLALRVRADAAERRRIDLRIAACDVALGHPVRARERLRPYLAARSRDPELAALYAGILRRLGRTAEFVRGVRDLTERFPTSAWTEQALDELGSYYLSQSDREAAARVFAELYERFPTGSRAERAAWQAGWWAYRRGDDRTAVRLFERAAADFPRSDYRPAYLYWAGRARERLGDHTTARARYELVLVDYGESYYGRLAARRLGGDSVSLVALRSVAPLVGPTSQRPLDPPTRELIRWLLALELYDDALAEVTYAGQMWGRTAALDATEAWIHHRRGDLRRGINAMKRAYPQYLSGMGVHLPEAVRRVLFPLAYWDLIERHARTSGLDPFLLAALVAQESTFDPAIRSAANAYGLMQLVPATGRRIAYSLGVQRFRLSLLTSPEWNLRLGTAYLARLLERFGALHLALAAYNAGPQRVARWLAERADLAPEEFIEDVPFAETRNYLKKILGTVDDYRRLYGGAASATSERSDRSGSSGRPAQEE